MMHFFTFRSFILSVLMVGFIQSTFIQAQCTLVAPAQFNIYMPSSCVYSVSASQLLLAGTNCPGGNLVVEILQGSVWVTANLNTTHIGQTLSARVRDLNSGNIVFCSLKVEDKTPPILGNCGNITVNCEDACLPIALPTVNDCSSVSFNETTTVINPPCSSTISKQVIKTYTATDIYNNVSSCTRTVNYTRRAPNTVVFPTNIVLQINGSNCTPWCNNGAGRPNPTPLNTGIEQFGSPLIDGSPIFSGVKTPGACVSPCVTDACQMTVTYSDAILQYCGTNRRVDRTWQVTSACGAPAVQNYLQRIWLFTDGNPTCGAACGTPYNLNQSYSSATGLTTFTWSAPSTTCVTRFEIHYRVKIGGVWQPWAIGGPLTNSFSASLPANVSAEWKVFTRCYGINSAFSPVKSFVTGSPSFQDTEDRSEDEREMESAPETSAPRVFDVFPNPSQGAMTFSFNKPVFDDTAFIVTSLTGQIVYQTPLMEGMLSMDLEMNGQPAGVYFATVKHADGSSATTRFIIVQ